MQNFLRHNLSSAQLFLNTLSHWLAVVNMEIVIRVKIMNTIILFVISIETSGTAVYFSNHPLKN